MSTVLQTRVGQLPTELTSFVGRQRLSAEVKKRLSGSRLVTLTGPAGVGKTRLALHVARELQRAFPDGVRLVELAQLQDPGILVNAMTAALELPDQSAREPLTVLVEFLADKRLLILLDNCEHVLAAAAAVLSAVLRSAPGVQVLATSRERVGVAGEQVLSVPPLTVPRLEPSNGGRPLQDDGVGQHEAVTLFEQRAAAVQPAFTVDPDNEAEVAQLCQRLDGLPLAIELAAVRLGAMSVGQILQHLEDRFRFLTTGHRMAPARQQTLRAAVEWSFGLCSPAEQVLWARLSLFAGEFDLEAAEQVCAGAGLAEEDILDAVSGLVEKSVVSPVQGGTATRYRMLETIRQYGREQLAARGEETLLRRRHRDYYLAVAKQADAEWFGPQQRKWWQRFQSQNPNLWAALDFCCTEPGQARTGLLLTGALWFHWIGSGFVRDGRYWLDRLLALSREPSQERARALWVRGWIAIVQGDLPNAERASQEGIEVADHVGDRAAKAHATHFLGWHAWFCDDTARASELAEQALAGYRATGQLSTSAPALLSFNLLASVHFARGDFERAGEACAEGRSICERAGEEWMLAWMRWYLGHARRLAGDVQAAEEEALAALRIKRNFNDPLGLALCIEQLGLVAMDRGDAGRAARLFGAVEPLWKLLGSSPLLNASYWLRWHRDGERHARKVLGDQAYEKAYRQGTQLGNDQAVSYALGEQAPATPTLAQVPAADSALPVLTRREQEVAMLVTQGLSNKEIAQALVISQRTAETHVEHILCKLGVTSRVQIVTWVRDCLTKRSST
ncbi:LuxR C-terminal-related transcriptional regulator [Saccharopolyspora sp. ASAGF58]|uniref:ATP-binding protein n=1 Tax=Saccharopolyspora sp. ASAGF58 TaxID=2719023 RepID=UPI00143FEF40|nr:LuxR C-terminal-related transcriptional regulator [Saccharopolyspora sp. ASAGF58]QIZ36542.1 LuxR family transcriptional regulator [Saccharopolyspora sp. ASAGF58]